MKGRVVISNDRGRTWNEASAGCYADPVGEVYFLRSPNQYVKSPITPPTFSSQIFEVFWPPPILMKAALCWRVPTLDWQPLNLQLSAGLFPS